MAVIEGGTSLELAGVGNQAFAPQHVSAGPMSVGAGGAYRLSLASGTMAVSLVANSEIFQFRFVTAASRVALIHGISISAAVNVAATTAVLALFRATIARAWTAAGTGGTRAVLTTNNSKLRTSHATSEVNDAGISSTAALTAGTKTLDTSDIGAVSFAFGTGAITTGVSLTLVPKTNLMGEFMGSLAFPIVLANQEGFVIRNGANAFPAGATWTFSVDVAWSEVNAF